MKIYKIILHAIDHVLKTNLAKEYEIKKLEKEVQNLKDYIYALRKTINRIDIDLADYTESALYQKDTYIQEDIYLSKELEILKDRLIGKKEDAYKDNINTLTKYGEDKYYRESLQRKAEAHSRQIDFSMVKNSK